jgi:branched-chain amino acid aminotransferase
MLPVFINFNGNLIPQDTQILTVNNRAFKYGDGLFESMRMIKGELKFAELHSNRLQKGMKTLKIDGYPEMDTYFLKEKAEELARRNKIKNGRLRLTVFRDADGFYTPFENKMAWCLELKPNDENQYKLNPKGLIVDLYTELTKPINFLSNIKTCNSLIYVMAGIYKSQNKLDEVILLNQNGFLCEASSSNIFVYYQKQLYTPALSEACVEGVMRQIVIDLARKMSIPITEAQINPNILFEADEVFITNASRGIQSVMGFGIKRYFNELSKMLNMELNKL